MNWLLRLLLAVLGVSLALLAANESAVAQTKIIDITVEGPRPMSSAIWRLEELSGIPINYEDMPVYYSEDVIDVTQTGAPTTIYLGGRHGFVARGGQLSVPIVIDAATGRLN